MVWLVAWPVPTALWVWQRTGSRLARCVWIGLAGLIWIGAASSVFGGSDTTPNTPAAVAEPNRQPQSSAPSTPQPDPEDPARAPKQGPKTFKVTRIVDGDTLALTDGDRVRLLQIDAAEKGTCSSQAATSKLAALIPVGTGVVLKADPTLDRVDRYGRLLRYVFHEGLNVNLVLVRKGAAAPYFFHREKGKYAGALYSAARQAKADHIGLWKACPGTNLRPNSPLNPEPAPSPAPKPAPTSCHPSYKGECLDPSVSDYDCAGGNGNGPGYVQGTVTVVGPDEYGLDADGDGYGCE